MRAFQSTELPQQIKRVWQLSVPAILTQISSIVMQYIDSAMVGNLGADASAAIGLVATSTWLLGGLCSAVSAGFSVQIAHHVGARDNKKARDVLKHGIVTAVILSVLLMLAGIAAPCPCGWAAKKSCTGMHRIISSFMPARCPSCS